MLLCIQGVTTWIRRFDIEILSFSIVQLAGSYYFSVNKTL